MLNRGTLNPPSVKRDSYSFLLFLSRFRPDLGFSLEAINISTAKQGSSRATFRHASHKQLTYSEQFGNKLFTQNGNCDPASYDHLLTSPIVLRRLQYFHNRGKIISHLTPSIESFHQTHFWPCIIHGYSSPTLAQGGSALSQSPSQDISL